MTAADLSADLAKRWKVAVTDQHPILGGVVVFQVNSSPDLAPLSVTQGNPLGKGYLFEECYYIGQQREGSELE